MLHSEQYRRVPGVAQELRRVRSACVQTPAEWRVRQPEHARCVRVEAGMHRRSAWAALWRSAEAPCESDALRREAVESRRRHRLLPVTAEVLPQIVAGEKQNVG